MRAMIPAFRPLLGHLEQRYVAEAVASGWISSRGPFVERFEAAAADACGARHAVSTTSGTTALHLGLATLGVGAGDEVLVPDLTFVATANVVRYCGAIPVLVDIDETTWAIDLDDARRKITPRTRGLIAVHLYGHPADLDPLLELTRARGLFLVEDAAQALGAVYRDRPVGGVGDLGALSFHGNKIVTTGEGGVLVTNQPEIAARAAHLRDHAMDPHRRYFHTEVGFNYRMTNLQAAIGCAQFEQLDALHARTDRVWQAYDAAIAGAASIVRPAAMPWALPARWMYTVSVADSLGGPDGLAERLRERQIDSRPCFRPLHVMPPYRCDQPFPVASRVSARALSLPSGPGLTGEEVAHVCQILRDLIASPAPASVHVPAP